MMTHRPEIVTPSRFAWAAVTIEARADPDPCEEAVGLFERARDPQRQAPVTADGLGVPAGKMVDIGGRSLYVSCVGESAEGEPTVVFENGMGSLRSSWSAIQTAISGTVRACAYDRAGMGPSDRADTYPRTAQDLAEDLATLLDRAGIHAPYVFVSHSIGPWSRPRSPSRGDASLHSDPARPEGVGRAGTTRRGAGGRGRSGCPLLAGLRRGCGWPRPPAGTSGYAAPGSLPVEGPPTSRHIALIHVSSRTARNPPMGRKPARAYRWSLPPLVDSR